MSLKIIVPVICCLLSARAMPQAPAWTGNVKSTSEMMALLSTAYQFGLDTADYHLPAIRKSFNTSNANKNDSLLFEAQLTGSALHFFKDLAYGSQPPAISYNGLGYVPACYDISMMLITAVQNNTIHLLADLIEPKSAEYISIKAMVNQLQQMHSLPLFKDERVTSATVSASNKPLVKRLWQLGIPDSIPVNITDAALKLKVKQAQELFNLMPDGNLSSTVLQELNTPIATRIAELKIALNCIRWLYCSKAAGPAIVVNIPSANLLVYEDNQVIMESRIIVGKKSTRTPTLTSRVNEVVLYPYWLVPKSIATKELLPLIKRNPGYLDANGMQVLNDQGKVLNPRTVNWSALSTANFPYVLRQSTGCDNSLGLVKLNFYNPYNVYLHDTPWKILFAANKRYFSHGCMRVEKAMDLAHLLLKGNTIAVDTLEDKGCLRNQLPIPVPATVHMQVFVLYNTAWVDSSATVRFNEDIYGRLPKSK